MAYFIVNYQLNKDGQDYQNLWDEFERLEAQKAQRTVYLVDCNANDASSLLQHLRSLIDANDMMLVCELTENLRLSDLTKARRLGLMHVFSRWLADAGAG